MVKELLARGADKENVELKVNTGKAKIIKQSQFG